MSAPLLRRALSRRLLLDQLTAARTCPSAFVRFCGVDSLGQSLRVGTVHHELQAFLSAHARALVELPRDHGKTVQMCWRLVWELGQAPGLRIKVVCASEALAGERCRFLRTQIADNERVRLVFPHLRPARPWTAHRLTVRRSAEGIGPSVAAFGVGAASTGARADLLVCDDIVDVRALHSRAERERVKADFRENLVHLLEPAGRLWYLFTPWHPDDLSAELTRNPAFAHFRRAVGPDLQPVWPEHWPTPRLAERRAEIGSVSFDRAYRLVATPPDGTLIRAEWLRTWTTPSQYVRIILAVDPAVTASARADASALVTLGHTADRQIHCLEALGRRVAAPELVTLIADADARWQPSVILFEANAAFAGLRDLLVRHACFGGKIKGLTQTRDKTSRVSAFSVVVENGTFRLHGDAAGRCTADQQALADELVGFPFAAHDDLLDAAAFGSAYLLDQREPRVWA
jgi:predicted phage terminase large subunit-like protein